MHPTTGTARAPGRPPAGANFTNRGPGLGKRPPRMRFAAFSCPGLGVGVAFSFALRLRAPGRLGSESRARASAPLADFCFCDVCCPWLLDSAARTRARLSCRAAFCPAVIYPGLSAQRVAVGQGRPALWPVPLRRCCSEFLQAPLLIFIKSHRRAFSV